MASAPSADVNRTLLSAEQWSCMKRYSFNNNKWKNLDHFPWLRHHVDLQRSDVVSSANALENPVLQTSNLITFTHEDQAIPGPTELPDMRLYERIPQHGELKRFLYLKSQQICEPLLLSSEKSYLDHQEIFQKYHSWQDLPRTAVTYCHHHWWSKNCDVLQKIHK